ncbi:MAG: glycosyltransferase [Isosphaeraceae bacterium]
MGFPSGPTPPRARSWHILAGEYPPQTGGVGDYTAQIAAGLARAGCDVHVWTTAGSAGESPRNDDEEGVVVHRAPSRWTRAGLAQLGRALEGFPQPRRLLVQYVPNVWGQKGMNIGFAHWLRQRAAAGDDVQTMFHELWYHIEQGDRLIRRLLPPVQKYMVRQILQASRRAFLSSTHWEGLLRPYLRNGGPAPCWTPVPSNVPVVHDPAGVAAIQRRILGDHAGADATIVGSFGTFQDIVAGPLLTAFPALLDASDGAQSVLLIGRGSQEFAAGSATVGPISQGESRRQERSTFVTRRFMFRRAT